MYFDNPATIKKLLESDALLRTIIDHIVITPDASIRVLLGSAIFISENPKIRDLEAIWTIRITGLPDSEVSLVKATIKTILGNKGEWVNNSLIIRQLATPVMIAEAEQAARQEQQQKAFEAAISYAQGLTSGKDGQPGPMGPPGPPGAPGRDGRDGFNGKDGRDGKDIDITQTSLFDLIDVEEGIDKEKGQVLTYDGDKWTNLFVPQLISQRTGTPAITVSQVTTPTYEMSPGDYYLGVNYIGPVTITLPESSYAYKREYIIKDESGQAGEGSNRWITIQTQNNEEIDGDDHVIIGYNYGSLTLIWANSSWRVI